MKREATFEKNFFLFPFLTGFKKFSQLVPNQVVLSQNFTEITNKQKRKGAEVGGGRRRNRRKK